MNLGSKNIKFTIKKIINDLNDYDKINDFRDKLLNNTGEYNLVQYTHKIGESVENTVDTEKKNSRYLA